MIVAAGFAACAIASSAAASPLNYLQQVRSVTATAYDTSANESDFESFTATGFGPFIAAANASAGAGSGTASQTSTLDPDLGISVRVRADAFGSVLNQAGGSGTSSFFTQFEVLEPVTATISFATSGDFSAVFFLSGPSIEIAPTSQAFDPMSMLLAPGTYSMTTEASYSASSPAFGGGSATASVIVPSAGTLPILLYGVFAQRRRARKL